ncbi:hypothetical protein FA13DRAFT_1802284 [Coprinellus micaceus]|uniref:Uncharacterized protein n=1 Tax=Coprinellus micaceus TaxID=71717 RepID=A0A4Y7SD23_COPMI|nr:hypothetical protein FA13DRAFT_1802284 [Coprinellus micaceus]
MECLEIRWQPPTRSGLIFFNADRWWLGSLFRALTNSPGFKPKLKSLVLDSLWITLNPGVAPSLASLTRFWFDSMAEVSPAFWVAMAANAVRLEYLRAGTKLDMGLVRYLTSYEGLQELHVYFGSRTESAEDESLNASLAEGFFTQAVLCRKNSLRILKCDGEYGPWSCETWLPQILLSTSLKELGILSHYPSPRGEHAHRTMPVGELISKIVEGLPHITRLSVKATRRTVAETPAESLNIYRLREYFAAVCMTEAIITAAEPPRFVSTPIAQFNLVPGPISGQYHLKMDQQCAQFLHPPSSIPMTCQLTPQPCEVHGHSNLCPLE